MRRSGGHHVAGTHGLRGSSRRAPERARGRSASSASEGFIPACAGAGRARRGGRRRVGVHPGVRRSGLLHPDFETAGGGSSRRAPERGWNREPGACSLRFIPACAGAGDIGKRFIVKFEVHPGVRRSGRSGLFVVCVFQGSSRRAPERGAAHHPPAALEGFIPACAGAGRTGRATGRRRRVHPGVRRSGQDAHHALLVM